MKFKKGIMLGVAAVGMLVGGSTASAATSQYSVVDYMASQHKDFSFDHRAELAADFGIDNYRGTANQNLTLLDELKDENGNPVKDHKASNPEPVSHHKAEHKSNAKPQQKPEPQTHQAAGRTINVEATAYTAYCAGCSGITATGLNLKANPGLKVIAVDPDVIPLGSKVYVEGYGVAIAGDTGGAINGHRIDIFMPSHQKAMDYGRRNITVKVLK